MNLIALNANCFVIVQFTCDLNGWWFDVSGVFHGKGEHTVISVFYVVKRYVSPSIAWLLLKIILWVCWWWTWWEWDMNQEVFSVSLFVLLLVFRHIYTTLSFTILLL